MVDHSTLLSDETWTMPTGGVNSTLAIGLSFIFLAYILHPAIEAAYQRVRAYHAWRCIEKQQRVDVTAYPMLSELFAGRGRWDAARVITLLLLAFSLASWILELSMDLNPVDNQAHLLTQPPPVFKWGAENDNGEAPWHVSAAACPWLVFSCCLSPSTVVLPTTASPSIVNVPSFS